MQNNIEETIENNNIEETSENNNTSENKIEKATDSPELFLSKETNTSKIIMFVTCLLMSTPFIASWVFIIIKANKDAQWYYYLIPGIIILFTMIISLLSIRNYIRLRKDYKNTDFTLQVQHGAPFSIIRMYKNLHTSLINLNWFSFSVYLYGGIIILLFYLLGGMDEDLDGKLDFLRFSSYKFTYYIICGTLIFIATNHAFLFILKTKKIEQIRLLFGNNVISMGELDIIKKMTRRRNMWITIAIFIVLLYGPIWLLKKLLKK